MNLEKRHLLHDLLDEQCDTRREAVLQAGGRILRRRRWRRRTIQSLVVVAILGAAAVSLQRTIEPRPPIRVAAPATPAEPHGLTDAELLALFPDTPVGLVTLENGRKQLIFPRPGDKERFFRSL